MNMPSECHAPSRTFPQQDGLSGAGLVPDKILDWESLLRRREEWRNEGAVVVWTNGCFDLMHAGHVRSLRSARRLGDILVVGLNSDASVRVNKGPTRPIMCQDERAEMLAGFECVDAVVIFEETTPETALGRLQPEIHCKGADYAPPHGKPVPEARIVEAYGGQVRYLPLLPGISTTELVARIERLGSDPPSRSSYGGQAALAPPADTTR